MFGTVDRILFPNECPVLEIEPGIRYVYPMFKNGSTSLYTVKKYRILEPAEIKKLQVIDVFVRDPHERFLSGVQTYLTKLPQHLDKRTLLFVIGNYLYLNRHYCPQIYWLINLSRFTQAKFHLRPISDLRTICPNHLNKSNIDPEIIDYFSSNDQIRFFNEMDEVLTVNLLNQTVDLEQVLQVLKDKYGMLYRDVFGRTQEIINAVS